MLLVPFVPRSFDVWTLEKVGSLVEVIARLAPARVLDVACGTGFLTRHLQGQVTALDQIYTGDVDVAFITNDTNITYDVGHVLNPSGVGPVDVRVVFESVVVAPTDFLKLLSGSFKVVLRGSAATTFATKGADATLQLTFTFSAFE